MDVLTDGMILREFPACAWEFMPIGDVREAMYTTERQSIMLHWCDACKSWIAGHVVSEKLAEDGFEGVSYSCRRCGGLISLLDKAAHKSALEVAERKLKSMRWPVAPVDPLEEMARRDKENADRRRQYAGNKDKGWGKNRE